MDASNVTAAKTSQRVSTPAVHPRFVVEQPVTHTAPCQWVREPLKADNAAPKLNPSTVKKLDKAEPNGHWVCVAFVT